MQGASFDSVELASEWGAPAPLAPLVLEYDVCETHENIKRNLRQTLESEYQPFNSLLSGPIDTPVSVCGFGPSLAETYTKLKGDVWACNGAHDWLIEKGVIPKFGMYWDASEVIAKFVHPHPAVTYLVASRCHRSVFEALEGHRVYVWHAAGDEYLDDLLCEYRKAEPMLAGGSAAVTRGMTVATTLGYRNIHLFGADSSYTGDYTHLKKSIVEEHPIEVWVDGRKFVTTTWLAGQVQDFKILAPLLKGQGCEIELYGDGMLQWVAHINGFKVHK
jgi:hypothetical protein